MLRFNTMLGNPSFKMTDEGFLHIKGNLLEADKEMVYQNRHGPVIEKIKKEILFNDEVKNSFLNKTVTFEHPKKFNKLTMVDSSNVTEFKKGTIIDVYENENCLGTTLQVEDKQAIDFILDKFNKNENIELSAGYMAETISKDGIYYQEKIKGNHVAILQGKGRAGSKVRLIYNYFEEENMEFKFNGKENLTAEQLFVEAEAVSKAYTELEGKYNSIIAETKEKEIKEIAGKFNVKEGATTLETMVNIIKTNNPNFNALEDDTVEKLEPVFNYACESLEHATKNNTPNKTVTTSTVENKGKFNSVEGRNAFYRRKKEDK